MLGWYLGKVERESIIYLLLFFNYYLLTIIIIIFVWVVALQLSNKLSFKCSLEIKRRRFERTCFEPGSPIQHWLSEGCDIKSCKGSVWWWILLKKCSFPNVWNWYTLGKNEVKSPSLILVPQNLFFFLLYFIVLTCNNFIESLGFLYRLKMLYI